MAAIKILIVGDPGSIHTCRFTSLLQELGYDVCIFQSEFFYDQDEHLSNTTIHVFFPLYPGKNGNSIVGRYAPVNRLLAAVSGNGIIRKLFSAPWILAEQGMRRLRARHLARLLSNWKPAVVFSLKMQNDGYTLSTAREMLGQRFASKWIHFNWGTDIEFFGKHPGYQAEHAPKIRKLLAQCDYHIADCKRDVRQAFEFGFRGISLGDCLANGGFDLAELSNIRQAQDGRRDTILIKGRQGGHVGKAMNILKAIQREPGLFRDFKIRIFLATPDVRKEASALARNLGLDCEVIPKVSYRELLALYARSRIAISATDVDGTPSFLIEAMAMGAFPIHSDMESIREWVEPGKNGLLFPVDDIDNLIECIRDALVNDALVENARSLNWNIAEARMDRIKIKKHLKALLEEKVLIGSQADRA